MYKALVENLKTNTLRSFFQEFSNIEAVSRRAFVACYLYTELSGNKQNGNLYDSGGSCIAGESSVSLRPVGHPRQQLASGTV